MAGVAAGEALARRGVEEALALHEVAEAGTVGGPVVGRGIAVADGPRSTERAGLL